MSETPDSVTVFYNKGEGWINILTCQVGASLKATAVEVDTYSDAKLEAWLKRSREGRCYVFSTKREE